MTSLLRINQVVPADVSPEVLVESPAAILVFSSIFFFIIAGLAVDLKILLRTNGRFPAWVSQDTWIRSRPWDRYDALLLAGVMIGLMLLVLLVVKGLIQY